MMIKLEALISSRVAELERRLISLVPRTIDLDRVKVDITLMNTVSGKYLDIPVIPEKITYKEGDQNADDYKVIGLGNVSFPNGVNLRGLSWQSFFPGRYDSGYCRTRVLQQPVEYIDWLRECKDNGIPVQVIIPAWDINMTMTVKSLSWEGQGFEGDIAYSLDFQEYKKVTPREVDVGGTVPDPANKTQADRAAPSADIVVIGGGSSQ